MTESGSRLRPFLAASVTVESWPRSLLWRVDPDHRSLTARSPWRCQTGWTWAMRGKPWIALRSMSGSIPRRKATTTESPRLARF